MVALRVGGVEVVASMRAWRLVPEPEMRTRRRGEREDAIVVLYGEDGAGDSFGGGGAGECSMTT